MRRLQRQGAPAGAPRPHMPPCKRLFDVLQCTLQGRGDIEGATGFTLSDPGQTGWPPKHGPEFGRQGKSNEGRSGRGTPPWFPSLKIINLHTETEEKARQPESKLGAIAQTRHKSVNIFLQRGTEEKARQPETKLSAIAQTRHTARLHDAKRSRTRNPKPTHEARDRPKQPQPRAGRDRASEPGRRHSSRRTRPTDTGTRCPGKGQR
jgi:hypothetical protein